jgi:hypothetical protein
MHEELMIEATKKGRVAFMQAQALAVAAEGSFAMLVRVRDGAATAAELKSAPEVLATTHRKSEQAVREAQESADRLLDVLGADAAPRVLADARTRTVVGTPQATGDR